MSLQELLETNTHEVFKEILTQKDIKFCINFFKDNMVKFGEIDLNMFPKTILINQKTFKILLSLYNKEILCNSINNVVDMYGHFEPDTWYVLCKYLNIQTIESFVNNITYTIDIKDIIRHAKKSNNSSEYLLNLVKKLQLLLTKTIMINYKTLYIFLNKLFDSFNKYFIEDKPCIRVYMEMYEFLECVKNQAISENIGRDLPKIYKLTQSLNKYFIKDLVFFITKYL